MPTNAVDLSVEDVYAEAREDYGVDANLEEFLAAVEDSRTVLEVQQELREERDRVKKTLSRLGLRKPRKSWPPVDLDSRVETIRNGELPRGEWP